MTRTKRRHCGAHARTALDRVAPSDPSDPMELFKHAQVNVLLHEPDVRPRVPERTA